MQAVVLTDSLMPSSHDTTLLVHAMTLPERIPLLLAAHACVPRLRVELLVRRRHEHHCSTAVQNAKARGWCGAGCSCVAAHAEPSHMHLNIAAAATGERDMLYAHADMLVNISALLSSLTGRASTASPLDGLMMRGVGRIPSKCIPIAQMTSCRGSGDYNYTCDGHRWWWWSRSDKACRMAGALLGLDACCYGWSDFVFLPARSQATFRRLATGGRSHAIHGVDEGLDADFKRDDLRAVMHEVAIPTILHHMRLQRWGGVPWQRVRCAGACCDKVRATEMTGGPLLCAHKVPLPALTTRRWSPPFRGFFEHSCEPTRSAGWFQA